MCWASLEKKRSWKTKISVFNQGWRAQHRYMIAGLFNVYIQLNPNTGQMSLITTGSLSDGGLLLVNLYAVLSHRLCVKDRLSFLAWEMKPIWKCLKPPSFLIAKWTCFDCLKAFDYLEIEWEMTILLPYFLTSTNTLSHIHTRTHLTNVTQSPNISYMQ